MQSEMRVTNCLYGKLLLMVFAWLMLFAGTIDAQQDSLRKVIRNSPDVKERLDALSLLSWELIYDSLPAARRYAEEELRLAKKENLQQQIASGYNDVGIIRMREGKFRQALIMHQQALVIRQELGLEAGVASSLSKIGNCYSEISKFPEALEAQQKALLIFRKTNNKIGIGQTLNNICHVYDNLKQYDKIKELATEASAILKETNDQPGMLVNLAYLATIDEMNGDNKSALKRHIEGIKIAEELRDSFQLEASYNNVGFYYRKLGNDEEGHKYYMMALKLAVLNGRSNSIALYNGNIGNFYVENGNYTEADKYLNAGLDIALKDSVTEVLPQLYNALGKLYIKTGQQQKAMDAYDQFLEATQRDFSRSLAEETAQLETMYDTEWKEQQNALLTSENEVIRREVREGRWLLSGALILAVLIALVLYLLFSRRRFREKARYQVEYTQLQQQRTLAVLSTAEAERVRIAREIHDGVGQYLAAAKLTFQGINGDEPDLNDQLSRGVLLIDNVVEEIRATTHGMSGLIIESRGLDAAVREYIGSSGLQRKYSVHLEIIGFEVSPPDPVGIMLFRILQELLANIIRHARADTITIQLVEHPDMYMLLVEDNGIGFNVSANKGSKGIGLENVLNRTEFLNGKLNIDSGLEAGTTVVVEVPRKQKQSLS